MLVKRLIYAISSTENDIQFQIVGIWRGNQSAYTQKYWGKGSLVSDI